MFLVFLTVKTNMGNDLRKEKPSETTTSKKKVKPKNKEDYENITASESRNLILSEAATCLNHPLRDSIHKYYTVTDKILGMGNFSVVKLGYKKDTNESCAIKFVDKSLVVKRPEMILNEIEILLRVKHPHIIELIDIFEDEDGMVLCMELVSGGELFDRIVERDHFSEESAAKVMSQLFDAIAYLHNLGIVHRDLKPENLLLLNKTDDIIKIADFGLSKLYSEEMMSTACGTPSYVAPEILLCSGYDKQIDMWSAGVIMYILLCGYPPFYNDNESVLFESIMSGNFEFHSPYWDHISPQAKDLIMKLLVVDPSKRLSAEEALNHPWFNITYPESKNVTSMYKSNLVKHNSTRRAWQKQRSLTPKIQ